MKKTGGGIRVSYILVILAAFALRTWRLVDSPLWYDETFSLYYAAQGPLEVIPGLLRHDNAPPLHGYLLALWTLTAGRGEFAVRYLQVLTGLAVVPLIGRWAGAMTGRRLSWGAMLALATSPIFVYYSQEARMYSLAVTLAAGYAWSAWRLLCSKGRVAPYVALGVAMLLAHPYTGFLWATCAVAGTVFWAIHDRSCPWWKANILLALLSLPVAAWLAWRTSVEATAYIGPTSPAVVWQLVAQYGVAQFLPAGYAMVFTVVMFISLLLAIVALARTHRWRAGLVLLLGLSLPVVLLLAAGQVKGKWSPQYLLPSWGLALVAGVGLGWDLLRERSGRLAGLLLALLWVGLALPAIDVQARGAWIAGVDDVHPRPDLRSVADYIVGHEQPDDVIVVVAGQAAHTLDYYFHDHYHGRAPIFGIPNTTIFDVRHPLDLHALFDLEALAGRAKRLWLVLWLTTPVDPTSIIHSTLVESCHRLPVERNFVNVGVLLFDLEGCHPALAAMPASPVKADFGPVRLLGYKLVRTNDAYFLDLWWEATGPVGENYTTYVHLLSAPGEIIAQDDRLLGTDFFPSRIWQQGTRLRMRHILHTGPERSQWLRVGIYNAAGRLPLASGQDGVEIPCAQASVLIDSSNASRR